MPGSAREPLEATVLPDLPAARGSSGARGWLLACGAFLLFVVCFALLLWGLGQLLARAGGARPSRSGSLLDHWETTDERLAAVSAALEAEQTGLNSAQHRELRRFFDKVRDAIQPLNGTAFTALVDMEAAADRVLLHPASSRRSRSERRLVEQQMQLRFRGPSGWNRLIIVHGERSADGEEALVYTIATGGDQPPAPLRWWLKRDGRSWRVCDWERIDKGFSETARWALEGAIGNSAEMAAFHQALEGVHNAQTSIEAGLVALGSRDLLDAQSLDLPPVVNDVVQLELAWAWERCARSDQVLAACDRIRDSRASPGVHYLRALAHWRREDFAAVLADAQQYRSIAGPHPHLLEVEADALEALGRRAEAAECWWKRLALTPDDADALAEYCRLAGESASRAVGVLRRAASPEEFALGAGRTAIYRDDDATLGVIERFFRELDPQAAALESLAAWRCEQRQEHALAAAHYRLAAERSADEQDRQRHFAQFLDAMAYAGRAAAGYQAADDPRAALAHLTAGLEYDEAPIVIDDLPQLIALHAQRAPQDPRLKYLEGLVAMADGQFAAAEAKFRSAAKAPAADPPEGHLAELARSKLVEAVYRQNRLAAAYQTATSPPGEVFRELALLCQQDRNWAALEELIALHRTRAPADPWIDYFLARRAQAQGNAEAGLAAVQRAEAASDETLRPTLGWLKNELLIQSGGIGQAYQGSSDQREAFRRLVTHLASEEDWDGVLELATLHAAAAPRRSATLYWRAAAHWHRGEYQELVDNLSPWPEDRVGRLEPGQLTELCDLLVRSLLRLGKLPEAQAAADRARDEYGVEPPMVALKLAQGDKAAVLELIEHPRICRELFGRQLYRDRELAPLLSDGEVAALRRQQALALPSDHWSRRTALVLFFAEPLPAQQLDECAAGATDAAIRISGRPDQKSLLWNLGSETVVLTAGSGPYCSCDQLPETLGADDPRRAALEQHSSWIALDLLPAAQPAPGDEARRLASQLSAALAELSPLALYRSGPRQWGQWQLESFDAAARQRLRSGAHFPAAASPPSSKAPASEAQVPIFASHDDFDSAERPDLGRALRLLADRARVANPAGHALIRVILRRGHAAEEQWLKVIRVRPQKDGNDEFLAEVVDDSQLWPFLRAGERLRVPIYEPLDVRETSPASAPSK